MSKVKYVYYILKRKKLRATHCSKSQFDCILNVYDFWARGLSYDTKENKQYNDGRKHPSYCPDISSSNCTMYSLEEVGSIRCPDISSSNFLSSLASVSSCLYTPSMRPLIYWDELMVISSLEDPSNLSVDPVNLNPYTLHSFHSPCTL